MNEFTTTILNEGTILLVLPMTASNNRIWLNSQKNVAFKQTASIINKVKQVDKPRSTYV
jgi:hypothetical protein